jgi:hypothetical protein
MDALTNGVAAWYRDSMSEQRMVDTPSFSDRVLDRLRAIDAIVLWGVVRTNLQPVDSASLMAAGWILSEAAAILEAGKADGETPARTLMARAFNGLATAVLDHVCARYAQRIDAQPEWIALDEAMAALPDDPDTGQLTPLHPTLRAIDTLKLRQVQAHFLEQLFPEDDRGIVAALRHDLDEALERIDETVAVDDRAVAASAFDAENRTGSIVPGIIETVFTLGPELVELRLRGRRALAARFPAVWLEYTKDAAPHRAWQTLVESRDRPPAL